MGLSRTNPTSIYYDALDIVLGSLLLILNPFTHGSGISIFGFEHVITSWE